MVGEKSIDLYYTYSNPHHRFNGKGGLTPGWERDRQNRAIYRSGKYKSGNGNNRAFTGSDIENRKTTASGGDIWYSTFVNRPSLFSLVNLYGDAFSQFIVSAFCIPLSCMNCLVLR